MTIVLVALAITSVIKEKKWITPVTTMLVLWAIIIEFSKLRLFGLYETSSDIYVYIFAGLISFYLGFMIPLKKKIIIGKAKNYSQGLSRDNNFQKKTRWPKLNYEVCYMAIVICILISILKLKDIGFDFSSLELFKEMGHVYKSQLINALFEFIAYPLYNVFVCVTVVDFFFGKKDKPLILLTAIMFFLWMLVSGGRIPFIRLFISIVVCMSLSVNVKLTLKNYVSNIKFLTIFGLLFSLLIYLTMLKGFDAFLNIYTDFAIQPKLFEHWANEINGQYAFGTASLFGFIYPILYIIKNALSLNTLPFGFQTVYANIDQTFSQWIVLGTFYKCNAYTSCFWYLYYDGRIVGIILGMFIWGIASRKCYKSAIKSLSIYDISIYCLFMIGIIYSFTDMEFFKASYVLAFLFINKICFNRHKLKLKIRGEKIR